MPLLSRAADPLLGVFTGLLAYYLYETNPRTAPPPQERLLELIKWKQAKSASEEDDRSRREEELRGMQSAAGLRETK